MWSPSSLQVACNLVAVLFRVDVKPDYRDGLGFLEDSFRIRVSHSGIHLIFLYQLNPLALEAGDAAVGDVFDILYPRPLQERSS